MLWKIGFHGQRSQLDALLDKEDTTLEDLLELDELLQEAKQGKNTRLMNFLSRPEVLRKLIFYTIDPSEEEDQRLKHRFPYVSAEILCSPLDEITNALFTHEDLLTLIFGFLQREGPLPNPNTLWFVRMVQNLYSRKPAALTAFLQKRDTVIANGFWGHMGTFGINEVVLVLLGGMDEEERPDSGSLASWWLKNGMIDSLLQSLEESDNEDAHLNTIRMLCEVVRRFHAPAVAAIARELMREATVSRLLGAMLKDLKRGGRCIVFTEGTNLIISIIDSLVRSEELLHEGHSVFGSLAAVGGPADLGGAAIGAAGGGGVSNGGTNAQTITIPASTYDPDAEEAAETEQQEGGEGSGETTAESKQETEEAEEAGEEGTTSVEGESAVVVETNTQLPVSDPTSVGSQYSGVDATFRAILDCTPQLVEYLREPQNLPPVELAFGMLEPPLGFARLKTVELLLVLMKTRKPYVQDAAAEVGLMGVCLDLFFQYHMNNLLHILVDDIVASVLDSGHDGLVVELIEKSKLLDRLIEAVEEDKRQAEQAPNGRYTRKGYHGHVTTIGNTIQLSRLPWMIDFRNQHSEWQAFVDGALRQRLMDESFMLGGQEVSRKRQMGADALSADNNFMNGRFSGGTANNGPTVPVSPTDRYAVQRPSFDQNGESSNTETNTEEENTTDLENGGLGHDTVGVGVMSMDSGFDARQAFLDDDDEEGGAGRPGEGEGWEAWKTVQLQDPTDSDAWAAADEADVALERSTELDHEKLWEAEPEAGLPNAAASVNAATQQQDSNTYRNYPTASPTLTPNTTPVRESVKDDDDDVEPWNKYANQYWRVDPASLVNQ